MIELQSITFGGGHALVRVRLSDDAPLTTDENIEATAHVYYVMPGIADHACTGDAGATFKDVMGATETAHLLEHMTIELMALTNMAGDVSCGRTRAVSGDDDRLFEIELAAPDDVLVTSALSSALWILDWALSGAAEPEPDLKGIVAGIVSLVEAANDQAPDPVNAPLEVAAVVEEVAEVEDGDEAEEVDGVEEVDEVEISDAPVDEAEVDELVDEIEDDVLEPEYEEPEAVTPANDASHVHLGTEVGFIHDES
jgi:hypothetical protein